MADKRKAVKVTPKQQLAINQLLIDPSLKVCAEVTGLSYDYVRELHTKTHILDALERSRKRVAERAEIDAAFVLRGAVEMFERCMQRVPVLEKVDGEWVPIGEFKFDSSGAGKALDIVAKHKAVQAYVPEARLPAQPTDTKWTVKVVHMTKQEFYEAQGNGKPPIVHRP
jgi:phage terminase small subunit